MNKGTETTNVHRQHCRIYKRVWSACLARMAGSVSWTSVWLILPCVAVDQSTSVTDMLNTMIERGVSGVYTGGKGVLVRSMFDTLDKGPNMGAPATLWSNDIFSVSQMYPDRYDLEDPTVTNVFHYATVGFVIGSSLSNLFYDFDNLQTSTWGWGVFYAHDSNSVDLRCRWLQSDNIYDCPGGYIPWGGTWISDSTKLGTGGYPPGNPDANSGWGGGAGCHVDLTEHVIDQLNQYDSSGQNLVQDSDCQCNYHFNQDWSQWVDLFAQNKDYSHLDFHADQGICWVSNVRDMINMQNWLFWKWVAGDWQQTQGTFSGTDPRDYMGWNEIPVTRTSVMDPSNWDSFVIKLPANLCGNGGGDDSISCLQSREQERLESLIERYVDSDFLLYGEENAAKRPGSYAVVAREWQDGSGNWFRWFFCEDWEPALTAHHYYYLPVIPYYVPPTRYTAPVSQYGLRFIEKTATNTLGCCYIESVR